jgi:long-chain acyl-CoA synthetase
MSPFFNGGGFAAVLSPIYFGGTCHIFPRFMAEPMLKTVQAMGITNMFMVPTQFHAMFNLGESTLSKYDRSSLKVINSNAAPLPQATKEKIAAYFGDTVLYDAYGSTEFGSATALRPYDQLRKKACVGLPQPGAFVELRRPDGSLCAAGEVGEIFVRTPWMFSGYLNRPEATREAIVDGWCTVGDLGRRDEEGYLYVVDRLKNVIISGGQNIFPREVEDVLYTHPAVAEAAVVGKPDAYWGESVTAFIELRPGTSLLPDELQKFCRSELSGYKIPKEFIVRETLPRNASGKIHHLTLREELKAAARTRGAE